MSCGLQGCNKDLQSHKCGVTKQCELLTVREIISQSSDDCAAAARQVANVWVPRMMEGDVYTVRTTAGRVII